MPFVPKSVSLWGHFGVAYIDNTQSLYTFNCETAAEPPKHFHLGEILVSYDKEATVAQIVNFGIDKVVLVASMASGDTLIVV